MSDDQIKDRRFATTLARGLSVLRAFRPSDDGLSNMEIAERTSLPRSTVSRLTFTLQSLGYLSHAYHNDRYRLGPTLLALGNVASASVSFVDLSGQIMQKLADDTGTLIVLAVRDNAKHLLVKTWRPKDTSSIWLEVGYRIPIIGSSAGMAFLASLSDEEFEKITRELDGELDADVAKSQRDNGYAQLITRGFVIPSNDVRFTSAINAVSVPFRSQEFEEPVSFTSGATPDYLTDDKMQNEVGPKLREAVQELARSTGQSGALVMRG